MTHQAYQNELRQWMGTQAGQDMLTRTARSVAQSFSSRRLSSAFLHQTRAPDTVTEEFIHEVRGELALFLLEKEWIWEEIMHSGNMKADRYIREAFISHWLDKSRMRHTDPKRYLRKRLLDALRGAGGFFITSGGKSSAFGMTEKSRPIPNLSEDETGAIPFPNHLISAPEYREINKNKSLTALAGYFWQQVSAMWGGQPVRIDVNDFIGWLNRHVGMEGVGRAKVVELKPGADLPAASSAPHFDPALVRKWAGLFSNRLSQTEKAVFYLRHNAELTYRQIADRLGYTSPSSPRNHLERAEGLLRTFLRELPGLSPDDLDEEAFSFFLENLFLILEKSVSAP